MVVKIYISGISGNKEVKKRQQRVLMILESKCITCEVVDITEPGRESDKEFMQKNSKLRDDQRHPLPPQMFNDEEYCGDYDDFDLSNEIDELEKFLKVPRVQRDVSKSASASSVGNGTVNGVPGSREASSERVLAAPVEESIQESTEPAAPDVEPEVEQPSADNDQDGEEEEEEEEEE